MNYTPIQVKQNIEIVCGKLEKYLSKDLLEPSEEKTADQLPLQHDFFVWRKEIVKIYNMVSYRPLNIPVDPDNTIKNLISRLEEKLHTGVNNLKTKHNGTQSRNGVQISILQNPESQKSPNFNILNLSQLREYLVELRWAIKGHDHEVSTK